jgi:hypothetical protein
MRIELNLFCIPMQLIVLYAEKALLHNDFLATIIIMIFQINSYLNMLKIEKKYRHIVELVNKFSHKLSDV